MSKTKNNPNILILLLVLIIAAAGGFYVLQTKQSQQNITDKINVQSFPNRQNKPSVKFNLSGNVLDSNTGRLITTRMVFICDNSLYPPNQIYDYTNNGQYADSFSVPINTHFSIYCNVQQNDEYQSFNGAVFVGRILRDTNFSYDILLTPKERVQFNLSGALYDAQTGAPITEGNAVRCYSNLNPDLGMEFGWVSTNNAQYSDTFSVPANTDFRAICEINGSEEYQYYNETVFAGRILEDTNYSYDIGLTPR